VILKISESGQNFIIVPVLFDFPITSISHWVIHLSKARKNFFPSLSTIASIRVESAFTTDDHTQ